MFAMIQRETPRFYLRVKRIEGIDRRSSRLGKRTVHTKGGLSQLPPFRLQLGIGRWDRG